MTPDETMTESDFYAAVRDSADQAWGKRPTDTDLRIDGLSGSIFSRLASLFTGGRD